MYKVMLIELPFKLPILTIEAESLKKNREQINSFSYCQLMAATWLNDAATAVLKIPSVTIKIEYNYLINL